MLPDLPLVAEWNVLILWTKGDKFTVFCSRSIQCFSDERGKVLSDRICTQGQFFSFYFHYSGPRPIFYYFIYFYFLITNDNKTWNDWFQALKEMSGMTVSVPMSPLVEWKLNKTHVKVAFRICVSIRRPVFVHRLVFYIINLGRFRRWTKFD